MDERALDLEGEREKVLVRPDVRRGVVDHAARRGHLLGLGTVHPCAQAVDRVPHHARVRQEGSKAVRAKLLGQPLLGLERDPAVRHHLLPLVRAELVELGDGLAQLERQVRDLGQLQPLGAPLDQPHGQVDDRPHLARFEIDMLAVDEPANDLNLLSNQRL